MKVLFLVPYPTGESPSQRFRFEQYFEALRTKDFKFTVQSFLDRDNWQIFYKNGKGLQKTIALLKGFLRRFINIVQAASYDFVFIHREATPLGPPVVEWLIGKILRKKIIYDFDDAIWMTDKKDESRLMQLLKYRKKVGMICSWSYKVSCGNEYLADYARRFNGNVHYNPTTIDETEHTPIGGRNAGDKIVIGWTGSHSTLKYLLEIDHVLAEILKKYEGVQVMVIADRQPSLKSPFVFVPWNKSSEIADLARIDIGIMPLPDDEWSKGKCGFKALQYMALEIPAVVSPVGVNRKIVTDGVNGFLTSTEGDWWVALTRLIEDASLRKRIGKMGRSTVLQSYSVSSNRGNFLSLFS